MSTSQKMSADDTARAASGLPTLVVALAGNPNSGKTTIFNTITHSHQHVGNYPGVTVEKFAGRSRHRGRDIEVVDLPGTYSLTAYSQDEVVARNFILDQQPPVVVCVVDATNLERNLYLATQLMEIGVPVVLALNMFDMAQRGGIKIDTGVLAALLGVPVTPTVGYKGEGLAELLDTALAATDAPLAALGRQKPTNFGVEIEHELGKLALLVTDVLEAEASEDIRHGRTNSAAPLDSPKSAVAPAPRAWRARWTAIKLLEDDAQVIARLRARLPENILTHLLSQAQRSRKHLAGVYGDPAEILLADRRYGLISGACAEAVVKSARSPHAGSDRIDRVVTNRYLGLPIFAAAMYLVFQMTFWIGNPIVAGLDRAKTLLAEAVRAQWGGPGSGLLVSLLTDGLIQGVGAVLVFVPQIMLLFAAISLLEDSGYMARAAFVLDRFMHKIGLHGKSFIPMLIGFGCTVPAIMATRTLETRRDRITTMLVLPLMSCGARLPVYMLILGAFFPARTLVRIFGVLDVTNQAAILFGIYALGIVLAVVCVKILRKTVLTGEVTPFVMELPPYRLPTLRGLALHVAEPTWMYVRKAGTIILAIVILMWALKTFPALPAEQQADFARQRAAAAALGGPADEQDARLNQIALAEHSAEIGHSAVGRIGRFVAPVLAPCGFDWKVSTALLGAVAAKEVFVGQMGVIYAVEEHGAHPETLCQRLAADYTPLQGICIILFMLIAAPCGSTVVVTARESGSWKWALMQWGYLTALAWLTAMAVFQIGTAWGT